MTRREMVEQMMYAYDITAIGLHNISYDTHVLNDYRAIAQYIRNVMLGIASNEEDMRQVVYGMDMGAGKDKASCGCRKVKNGKIEEQQFIDDLDVEIDENLHMPTRKCFNCGDEMRMCRTNVPIDKKYAFFYCPKCGEALVDSFKKENNE